MALPDIERSRIGWWFLGLALAGALVFVVHAFIGTFVFGLFLYYATRPIYRRLRRRLRPPSLAAAVSLFALALPALLLVIYALLIVVRQAVRYTDSGVFDLSQYPVDQELLTMVTDPRRLLELDPASYLTPDIVRQLSQSLSSAVDTVAFLGIGAVHLFVMIALAFYLLRDDRRLAEWVVKTFDGERGIIVAFGSAVDEDLNAVFFGNILNAVLTGTIGVIAYTLLNVFAPAPEIAVPAAGLVGLLAGVASIIPVVGMKLVYIPVALYMAAITLLIDPQLLWFVVAFAAISFVVVDTIPDLVLRPYVSGRSLHVGSVMIAYTFGPLLFGWYGIFLMPMLLVLVFHFGRIVLPELIGGYDIRPGAVDPGVLAATDPGAPVEGQPESGVAADAAAHEGDADGEALDARRTADADSGNGGEGETRTEEEADTERADGDRPSPDG